MIAGKVHGKEILGDNERRFVDRCDLERIEVLRQGEVDEDGLVRAASYEHVRGLDVRVHVVMLFMQVPGRLDQTKEELRDLGSGQGMLLDRLKDRLPVYKLGDETRQLRELTLMQPPFL